MTGAKHLILDVNVIVDLWLGESSAEITEVLLDKVDEAGGRLWVAASSLPTLDYIAR